MPKYFYISGYFKDDPDYTFEDYLVKSTHDVLPEEDDCIFEYGLDEEEIKNIIAAGTKSECDYVITSYRKYEY